MRNELKSKNGSKSYKKFICGAITGLCNGLFGAGGGVIAVFALEKLLKYPPTRSHASALCIILPLTCVSIALYAVKGKLDLSLIWYVTPAFFVGSILGAKFFSKLSNKLLSQLFIGITLIGAVFMLIL